METQQNKEDSDTRSVTLRLKWSLYYKLSEIADKETRTMSDQITHAIKKYLEYEESVQVMRVKQEDVTKQSALQTESGVPHYVSEETPQQTSHVGGV